MISSSRRIPCVLLILISVYVLFLFFYKKLKILDKKKSYKASVPEWFVNDRVNETLLTLKQSFIATLPPGENEIVSKPIIQNTKTNFLLHFIIFSMQPTL